MQAPTTKILPTKCLNIAEPQIFCPPKITRYNYGNHLFKGFITASNTGPGPQLETIRNVPAVESGCTDRGCAVTCVPASARRWSLTGAGRGR